MYALINAAVRGGCKDGFMNCDAWVDAGKGVPSYVDNSIKNAVWRAA